MRQHAPLSRLWILEWYLLAESHCTALASVSMIGYLKLLPRSGIGRHVPEPHAVAAADMHMPIAVRASLFRCVLSAFEAELQTMFSFCCYIEFYKKPIL